MISRSFAVLFVALILALPALADDATPDDNVGRYTFSKVADGFVRLDMQTGEVSLCSPRTVGWACQAAPEDRAVLENEITRLRSENAKLKKDLLARGLPLPPGVMPEPSTGSDNDITLRLPDNSDFDHAVAFVDRIWHEFVAALNRAQKQMLNRG